MRLGDVVVITGALDERVRKKAIDGLLMGTLEQFLIDHQVSVLLPDGDIWVGLEREISLAEEQV